MDFTWLAHMLVALPACVVVAVLAVGFYLLALMWRFPSMQKGTVAFFHPFADGGGGGERVLWCAVQAVHEAAPHAQILIYAHKGVSVEALVKDAEHRFNVDLSQVAAQLHVVPLLLSHLLLPESWPRLTLLGQAWGAVRVGQEALQKVVPEVFIETTGWAFTYPLARLTGCRVAAYTHYPTVSTDMIRRVAAREATYNNDAVVAGSPFLSGLKLIYYNVFATMYGAAGGCAHVVMANGRWTQQHLKTMFWRRTPPLLVYPPCDTEQLQKLPLDRRLKQLYLVSVAQFRPEKNHRLQLEAFAEAKARAGDRSVPNSEVISTARLKMVGSCRNDDDRARLAQLQQYAFDLGISDSVDWCVNVSFQELQALLGEAVGGLHTMRDEHFGISVVEYMAAGAVPIAHNSAGPKEDIVLGEANGFLATTLSEFSTAIVQLLVMDQRERLKIAGAARRHAARFSGASFKQSFTAAISPLLPRAP